MVDDENNASAKPSSRPFWAERWFFFALGAVVVLWLLTPVVMWFVFPSMTERGQAGDLFGSTNALFSGLAFVGIIVAILLQREELSLQRQELALTRQELERAASAQEKSYRALQATMYAQTFKVALDFLDAGPSIDARKILNGHRNLMSGPVHTWQRKVQDAAEIVVRSFESVGALVSRELIPADYLTSTRSGNILDYWELLRPYVVHVREARNDRYFGGDFETLAKLAVSHTTNEWQRNLQRDGL